MGKMGPLALFLVFATAAACGDEETGESTTPTPPDEAANVTVGPSPPVSDVTPGSLRTAPAEAVLSPTTVPVGTSRCNEAACLAVNEMILHPFIPESDGSDGVLLDIAIENKTVEDGLRYSVTEFLLVDSESFAYQPHQGSGNPPLAESTVPPGLKSRGQILFLLPEGAQFKELRWTNEDAELTVELDVPNPPDT